MFFCLVLPWLVGSESKGDRVDLVNFCNIVFMKLFWKISSTKIGKTCIFTRFFSNFNATIPPDKVKGESWCCSNFSWPTLYFLKFSYILHTPVLYFLRNVLVLTTYGFKQEFTNFPFRGFYRVFSCLWSPQNYTKILGKNVFKNGQNTWLGGLIWAKQP